MTKTRSSRRRLPGPARRKAKRKKSAGARRQSEAYLAGWRAAYPLGLSYGRRVGACEAVAGGAAAKMTEARVWPVRLLFVVSGQGDPYAAIERGLLASLKPLVAEVIAVSPFDNVVQTAMNAKPDLVLVFNGLNYVHGDTVQAIRDSGIRTAVWFTDDPYYADLSGDIALRYDVAFTQEISCVEFYRNLGCPEVHYLPLGVAESIYRPVRAAAGFHTDICFLGSGYRNRIALFDELAPYVAGKKTLIAGRWWERLQRYDMLREAIRGDEDWLSPADTCAYYNGAKIVINYHRAYDDDEINANRRRLPALSPNPRTFEIAACGAFQIVDAREDLARFYVPGQEIETFSSAEELAAKLDYYLANEEARCRIALNGLARTFREHTYRSRLQALLTLAFGP
ncbi:CgeB family protein [Paenibacillus hamazuiensis]|uniref:CgeB family protein n=1 Tax=Paenibacillus hamazuiensis TaxID=2936508 RepID=UPI00200C0E43|nr:glycosyltransferase [Paenibacillus hamazuiensis]